MTGAIAPWASQDQCLSGCRFKITMHPQFATSPIIWFKGRPIRTGFPLSTGSFFKQALDDEHTAYGIEAYTLNKSGLLKVQIVWGIQSSDGFVYALQPDQAITLEEAKTDAEIRLVRGRLFAIAIARTGCADFARLDWQACTRMKPGYAPLFSLGERFQKKHSRADLPTLWRCV